MRNGKFRHFVEVQEAVETADSFGHTTQTWKTKRRAWVKITPTSDREFVFGSVVAADATHAIEMRAIAGYPITPKHRFVKGSRVFNLIAVSSVDDREIEIRITAKEVINGIPD